MFERMRKVETVEVDEFYSEQKGLRFIKRRNNGPNYKIWFPNAIYHQRSVRDPISLCFVAVVIFFLLHH